MEEEIRIAHIVGARPQFIKYFALSKAMESFNKREKHAISDILIHTGQHYDYNMSDIFFDQFGIKKPDYHLGVGSGTHGVQTGQILERVEAILSRLSPHVVVVYGDTNSTLGGALASAKLHIPVAHIEAGLRSYNRSMPEEMNRVLTDHLSNFLFCPSENAVRNLKVEGFTGVCNAGRLLHPEHKEPLPGNSTPKVINVGDVMYDVLLYALELVERESTALRRLNIRKRNYYLLTLHRAESTDNLHRLEEIVGFVNDVSAGKTVIFPMHPRTKTAYEKSSIKFKKSIQLIEPMGYFDILALLKNCLLVMTDSGGMQKEAFWLKIPCITLRDETEWIETVHSGWNVLYKNFSYAHTHRKMTNCYGDGKAASRIVGSLFRWLLH